MQRSTRCAKCDGTMFEGFILDEGYGYYRASVWQADPPVRSFWTGIRQSKADQIKVVSLRCDRCGYLESYAPR